MSRKMLLTAAALLTASTLWGQTFVGGTLDLSLSGSSETEDNTRYLGPSTSVLWISPGLGYFLSSELAVGASVGLRFESENNREDVEVIQRENLITIAPFARYYLMETNGLRLMGQASLGLGFGGSSTTMGGTTVEGPSQLHIDLALRPGVAYPIGERIEIEAFLGGLSYSLATTNIDDDESWRTGSFNLSFSTGLALGFIYKF